MPESRTEILPSTAKLKWQCRRGMLELDLLFDQFLENHYELLDEKEKIAFVELLKHNDQDLQQWLLNKSSPSDKGLLGIISRINSM